MYDSDSDPGPPANCFWSLMAQGSGSKGSPAPTDLSLRPMAKRSARCPFLLSWGRNDSTARYRLTGVVPTQPRRDVTRRRYVAACALGNAFPKYFVKLRRKQYIVLYWNFNVYMFCMRIQSGKSIGFGVRCGCSWCKQNIYVGLGSINIGRWILRYTHMQ